MTLVVFLRGVNVGGRRFRPAALAEKLRDYDVVSVGAAGTFVVRKPGARAKLLAELRRHLPFEAEIACCNGRDLLQLETENPFGSEPSGPPLVRFVSFLSRPGRRASLPLAIPVPAARQQLFLAPSPKRNDSRLLEPTAAPTLFP